MNPKHFCSIFSCICLLLLASCQRPLIVDDDQTSIEASWSLVDYESERLILGLHATPFEWYAISENQFSRFDGDNGLLEKRPLSMNSGVLGIPAMSDNSFFRLTADENSQQILEFHLTRNPAQIWKIPIDSLTGPGDGFLEVETDARTLGDFSSDGTLFLLPIRVLPERHYALLLFEITHNLAHDEFTAIEVVARIDLEELSAQSASLSNVRFVGGNFYVASREGAWRVTPSGGVKKIFSSQWMRDIFSHDGKLYVTGLDSFDMNESSDNGLTWSRLNVNSDLEIVTTPGDLVLTQTVLGKSFSLADSDLLKARSVALPAGADPNLPLYYGAIFYASKYYLSIDRKVYHTNEVLVN